MTRFRPAISGAVVYRSGPLVGLLTVWLARKAVVLLPLQLWTPWWSARCWSSGRRWRGALPRTSKLPKFRIPRSEKLQ